MWLLPGNLSSTEKTVVEYEDGDTISYSVVCDMLRAGNVGDMNKLQEQRGRIVG